MDKFKQMCEKFRGEFESVDSYLGKENRCVFENLDDFKMMIHWMSKQKMPSGKHRTRWEMHEGIDFHEMEFYTKDDERTLILTKERSLGDTMVLSEYISEQARGKDIELPWSQIFNETASEELLKDVKAKPYLMDDLDIEVGLNNDWDYYYVKGIVVNKLHEGSHLPSILDDAKDAVDDIVEKAETRFYSRVDNYIKELSKRKR